MRFDEFWSDDAATTATESADLPLLPDGRHVGEIKVARFKAVEWKKTPTNPAGMCLTLCVEVAGHQAVWADCPVQFRGLIESVCRAASVQPPAKGEDWDESVLKGHMVSIETVQGIGKSGRQYVRIDKWHPGPGPLPKEVAAKPAAKSPKGEKPNVATTEAYDDIPF